MPDFSEKLDDLLVRTLCYFKKQDSVTLINDRNRILLS